MKTDVWTAISEDFTIPVDSPYFEGHFPNLKIYPAMAQLDHVAALISKFLKRDIEVVKISKAKFMTILKPESTFRLEVSISENRFNWALTTESNIGSKGSGIFLVVDRNK